MDRTRIDVNEDNIEQHPVEGVEKIALSLIEVAPTRRKHSRPQYQIQYNLQGKDSTADCSTTFLFDLFGVKEHAMKVFQETKEKIEAGKYTIHIRPTGSVDLEILIKNKDYLDHQQLQKQAFFFFHIYLQVYLLL